MGGKSSHYMQADRPESGGANHDEQREKSGLLDREKEHFAQEEAEKRAEVPEQESGQPAPFSVGSPRNPNK